MATAKFLRRNLSGSPSPPLFITVNLIKSGRPAGSQQVRRGLLTEHSYPDMAELRLTLYSADPAKFQGRYFSRRLSRGRHFCVVRKILLEGNIVGKKSKKYKVIKERIFRRVYVWSRNGLRVHRIMYV